MPKISRPYKAIEIVHRRGDTFRTRIMRVKDVVDPATSATVPGNFTGSSFRMQIRLTPEDEEVVLEVLPEEFLLSQSQEAIDFDVAEGNAVGFTKDELFVEIPPARTEWPAGRYSWDLEWTTAASAVQTFIGGDWRQLQDVTR